MRTHHAYLIPIPLWSSWGTGCNPCIMTVSFGEICTALNGVKFDAPQDLVVREEAPGNLYPPPNAVPLTTKPYTNGS